MAQPLELATCPALTLHKTMILIILLNGIFGLCGYVRFGDTSQGSISLNLPTGEPLVYQIYIFFYYYSTVWIVYQF